MKADRRAISIASKDAPAGFAPRFADAAAWQKRAAQLRIQTAVALGLWPMPPRPRLSPVVTGTIDRDEYTIDNVYFASLPGHYVTGNLYRPRHGAGPLPAVLCPYGHWPGGRLIWRSDAECEKEFVAGGERTLNAARAPMQAACATLARLGCVVFQYDMVGYCDSQPITHTEGFTDVDAVLRCQSMLGLHAWNSARALDFVMADPSVDPARVAITGASGGATQSIALAAVDDRLSASFPIVMVSMNMQGGCVCENAPLYRVDTNNVELALLAAPRPLGMVAADDWTRDFETRGLPEMRTVYELLGAGDRVEGRHLPFKHNFNVHSRERLYDFMNRHLGLGRSGAIREAEFVPIIPDELHVFNAAHPLPADAIGAAGVRRWMTETATASLDAMRSDPKQRVAMLRSAWRAMIVDAPPAGDDVEVTNNEAVNGDDVRITRGTLSRRDAGEAVPYVLIEPSTERAGPSILLLTDAGTAAPVTADGALSPVARRLIDAGCRVISIGLFASAEHPAMPFPPVAYAGFSLGYNRSTLASRAHDVLTAMAAFRAAAGLRLVASGEAAVSALIAVAVAESERVPAAVDLGGFDFDQVSDVGSGLLVPGAIKYGGVASLIELCGPDTWIANVPAAVIERFEMSSFARVSVSNAPLEELVQHVLGQHA